MSIRSKPTPTEKIAEDTWWRVKWAWEWGVRLGEVTLTDLLVLDFVRFMPRNYRLFQTNTKEESERGTDLEIRIYDQGTQAALLAIQAKKLYQSQRPYPTGGYYRLDTKAKFQIEKLERYSRKVGAIPLYLLYNYVDRRNIEPYWRCCLNPDKKQLGCTLVPSLNIRQALKNYKRKNFDWIHRSSGAMPWHCIFDCTQGSDHRGQTAARRSLSLLHESFRLSDNLSIAESVLPPSDDYQNYNWVRFEPVEGAWPEWLWERHEATLSAEDCMELWGNINQTAESNAGRLNGPTGELFPRRLLLVKEGTD